MKDVEADGYWADVGVYGGYKLFDTEQQINDAVNAIPASGQRSHTRIRTFRLDRVVAMLPEWCFYRYFANWLTDDKAGLMPHKISLIEKIASDINSLRRSRGQPAANAAAKLLHLLWEEKLV
jgi:hypothetical protein